MALCSMSYHCTSSDSHGLIWVCGNGGGVEGGGGNRGKTSPRLLCVFACCELLKLDIKHHARYVCWKSMSERVVSSRLSSTWRRACTCSLAHVRITRHGSAAVSARSLPIQVRSTGASAHDKDIDADIQRAGRTKDDTTDSALSVAGSGEPPNASLGRMSLCLSTCKIQRYTCAAHTAQVTVVSGVLCRYLALFSLR